MSNLWANKGLRYSLIIIFSIIVLGYLAIVLTSIDTYYPGTIINGKDFGFKSPLYVDNELYINPSDYNLEIAFRDKSEVINGRDISLSINYLTELNDIKKTQNPFLWPSFFNQPEHKLTESVTFNEENLDRIVSGFKELDEENMTDPKNPIIDVNEDGIVTASLNDQGNRIDDIEGLKKRIKEAIVLREERLDVEEEGFYTEAEYALDSDQVERCVEFCNTIAELKITYKYGNEDIKLNPKQLFSTIKISDDYKCIVSKERVGTVIESFSRLYDTYDSIRVFKTHNRNRIKITNSRYGWQLDTETETDNLYNDIIHKTNVERTPAFLSEGYYYKDGDDIGDTYAEVDLSNQHMYYYENGKVALDCDVVTGNVGLRRGTPGGIYSIAYKQSPAILKGEDYETPVTFWMPFNGGIGFHDATWRGRFGGDIYLYGGSHGCVNMPYSYAQELYHMIEPGTPVIVY